MYEVIITHESGTQESLALFDTHDEAWAAVTEREGHYPTSYIFQVKRVR